MGISSIALTALMVGQQAPQQPLELACIGRGTGEEGDFSGQVDIRLFDGNDRIRLPSGMLALVHGGQSGWFKLKNVTADTRTVRASAEAGFLSTPKVFIDRVTGTISISGRDGNFAGQCEAIQANAPTKF